MAAEPISVADAVTRMIGDRNRSHLAKQLGIPPSTITRWASGAYRPNYEDIARLEDACDHRRGWVLAAAGFVHLGTCSVPEAIDTDPDLDDTGRQFVLGAWETARSISRTSPTD